MGGVVARLGDGASGGGLPFADEVLGDVHALHGRERHGWGSGAETGIRGGSRPIRRHETRGDQSRGGKGMIGVEEWRSGSEEVGGSRFDSEEKGGEDLGFFKGGIFGEDDGEKCVLSRWNR